MHHTHIRSVFPGLVFSLLILLGGGCDFPEVGGKPDLPELQTIILSVRVEPQPVAEGDTTTFTALIADSLDERFQFFWSTDGEPPYTTEENRLEWIANKSPDTHSFSVQAYNPFKEGSSPTQGFPVTIVALLPSR